MVAVKKERGEQELKMLLELLDSAKAVELAVAEQKEVNQKYKS